MTEYTMYETDGTEWTVTASNEDAAITLWREQRPHATLLDFTPQDIEERDDA